MPSNRKSHWETVYQTKQSHEVSWVQIIPQTSLDFIHSFNLPKTASIIDVGAGDSKLIDFLLAEGFENLTALDISETALDKARQRLGSQADKVRWIASDILDFQPDATYDLWHDRATLHFLTEPDQIERYLATVGQAVSSYLVIGTFSENGPRKCSGLDVKPYTEADLQSVFSKAFEKIRCVTEDHITPGGSAQNFRFCSFLKRASLPAQTHKFHEVFPVDALET